MAAITLRNFGGMQPSANAKSMQDSAAVLARDIELRFNDFRPLPAPADLATPMTPGQTLYRFHGAGWFITNPGIVNYVRGPIPNDALERTYYTGDGFPKVVTQSNEVRQLGVPAPLAAPGVVVNVTDEYSTDDAAADQGKKLQEMVDAARAGYDWPFVGLSDADLARFIPNGDPSAKWSFSFKMPGSMVNGAFVPTNPNHANLMHDVLGFHLGTLADGNVYGFCDMDLRGQQIVIRNDFNAPFQAIMDPSDATKRLLKDDQIATIKSTLQDALTPADTAYAVDIDRLRNLKDQFVALADTGSAAAAANIGAVTTFYQRSEVATAIDAAVQQAVSAIFAAMFTYNNPVYTTRPSNGGGKYPYYDQQEM